MALNVRTYVRTPSRRTLDNAGRIVRRPYGGVSFVIVHSVYQAGNAAERFRKNALTRRTYVRTFPKNTESLQSWSFSNRNDRKTILRILRGDIDFSKKKSTFWI